MLNFNVSIKHSLNLDFGGNLNGLINRACKQSTLGRQGAGFLSEWIIA